MSERIEVRGDIKIAGGSGDAVRGEVTALTRWVPAGQAVRSPAGGGDLGEPHRRLRPGRPGAAAMTAAHRARECYTRCVLRLARLRLLAGSGQARRCRPVRPAKWARRPGRSWPKPAPPGKPPWLPWRKAAAVRRRCSWRPGRRGWRQRQMRSSRRLRTAAPRRCPGACAGSRRSPRRCGRCSPGCAPRRRPRRGAPGGTGSRMRTPDRGPAASGA